MRPYGPLKLTAVSTNPFRGRDPVSDWRVRGLQTGWAGSFRRKAHSQTWSNPIIAPAPAAQSTSAPSRWRHLTKSPSFECAACGTTLETWNTAWVPSYRLIAEPVRLRQLGREKVIMSHCVVVRAYGGKLDRLRGAAYRIARDNNTDWWAEAAGSGTKFCFEDAKAKVSFSAICERENVQHT
jgi:hypothetical protein